MLGVHQEVVISDSRLDTHFGGLFENRSG